MQIDKNYEPEFESIKDLILDIAQERSAELLLAMIVDRLAQRPHVALARIWLIKPGDICVNCTMRPDCPDQTKCLHLVAGAGLPLKHEAGEWQRLDGDCRRLPIGVGEAGRIAATGEAEQLAYLEQNPAWIERNAWAHGEGILSFGGQPLLYKDEALGVIVLYFRIDMERVKEGIFWLRMIANHAAIAMANARAFAEIEFLKKRLELENVYLREELDQTHTSGGIIGWSQVIQNVLQQIKLVAPTDASVLIIGESGTGKELVAREIQRLSNRSTQPLIKVNCASIPSELYESEFFGHVKGAFTGAVKNRAGRFEAADGGTLFLDEIGEIPVTLQGQLLRVLQEGEYERIGEEITRKVNVRIIAATNRDIRQEVERGRFRQDLYYRLNVFPIEIAPLRKHKEDIPLLAEQFLKVAAKKLNRSPRRLVPADLSALASYDWPGNVRELQNVIERAVIVAQPGTLYFDLPKYPVKSARSTVPVGEELTEGEKILTEREMRDKERRNIFSALQLSHGRVYGPGGAAEILGLKPTTLMARIKKLELKRPNDSYP
jgi:transcriptional regulator with GAF, ATPase, and Fis domain